jgi:hypothetical protein
MDNFDDYAEALCTAYDPGDSAPATNLIQAAATRKNRPRKEFLYWSSISMISRSGSA